VVVDSVPTDPGLPPPVEDGPQIPPDDDDGPGQVEHDEFRFTDQGNGKLMATLHGHRIRYCYPWNKWLVWDWKRWRIDDIGAIQRVAKDVTRWMAADAAMCGDEKLFPLLIGWARDTAQKGRTGNMLAMCQSEPGVAILPDQMDRNPWLFNCENGTIDLRTGNLGPHCKMDHITKLAPVIYDRDAKAPRWEQFEEEIFLGDRELIMYVRRTIGIALTGSDEVQELNIWYGEGSNGKNVYYNTILAMMGDYGCVAEPDLLLAAGTDKHPTGVADLLGRRFVVTSEIEEGRQLAEALFKRLTGDRHIKARKMHQDFFDFLRTFKLFLAVNHRPEVKGRDYATWRRIRLNPFLVTFVKAGQPIDPPNVRTEDPTLGAALLKELPGILNLMVDACLDWQANGLRPPPVVIAATEEYRQAMNHIPEFLAEGCVVDAKAKVATDTLYAWYTKWCRTSNYDAMSKNAFGRALTKAGHKLLKSDSHTFRMGLKVRGYTGFSDAEEQIPATEVNIPCSSDQISHCSD
jgi:putative DNA primase/helicase